MAQEDAGSRFFKKRDKDIEEALAGNDPKVLNEWAFYYFNTDQYEEAIDCFLKIVDLDPDFPAVHFNLGCALMRVGLVPESVLEFREALRRTPDDPEIHFNLALSLNQLDDNAGAIAALEKALALKPDYREALLLLGSIHAKTGSPAQAARAFETYLRHTPDADNADVLQEYIQRLRREAGS